MSSSRHFPPEWSSAINAVMIAYPAKHTDWDYMLEEARCCFDEIIKTLSIDCDINVIVIGDYSTVRARFGALGFFNKNILVLDAPYNDTWARDFGPITVLQDGVPEYVDFRFNGWGLKYVSNLDNTICRNMETAPFVNHPVVNRQNFILEGGSIDTDGDGTILTTEACLLSENRNSAFDKKEIEDRINNYLGTERLLWLKNGALEGDDTDSHIDTLARFISPDTIVYTKCQNIFDTHFHCLNEMEKELRQFKRKDGKPYNLVPLPLPKPIYDENGMRLPATYANFLMLPHHILLPTYGDEINDQKVIELFKNIVPDHKVIDIDCRPLIRQHGSLHCVTMQMIL